MRLKFLRKAKGLGLGDYDLSTIEIIGELKSLPDFKLPPLGGEAILQNASLQEMIHNRSVLRPQVDPALCMRSKIIARATTQNGNNTS